MLFGLLLAHRNFQLLSLPLLNVVVFFPAVYYICHTNARYRHPIDTVVVVLSAYSIVWLVRAIRGRTVLWRPFKRRPEAISEV
jgi:hypothetical protein